MRLSKASASPSEARRTSRQRPTRRSAPLPRSIPRASFGRGDATRSVESPDAVATPEVGVSNASDVRPVSQPAASDRHLVLRTATRLGSGQPSARRAAHDPIKAPLVVAGLAPVLGLTACGGGVTAKPQGPEAVAAGEPKVSTEATASSFTSGAIPSGTAPDRARHLPDSEVRVVGRGLHGHDPSGMDGPVRARLPEALGHER